MHGGNRKVKRFCPLLVLKSKKVKQRWLVAGVEKERGGRLMNEEKTECGSVQISWNEA